MAGHRPHGAPPVSRRAFLGVAAAALSALALDAPARLAAQAQHPDPRPGVTGSKVLTGDQLHMTSLQKLFDSVREMPHIADGIGCYCGCASLEGYRSLLSCYEAPGMAQHCVVCQGEARLAHSRWKEGQTLEQIRRAIDARFGHGAARPAADAQSSDHCAV